MQPLSQYNCSTALRTDLSVKYVPEWFPGASFQRKARKWKDQGYEMRDKTFEIVKRDMVHNVLLNWAIFLTDKLGNVRRLPENTLTRSVQSYSIG